MTEKGVPFENVDYLVDRISAAKLRQLLASAGLKPEDAIRRGEPAYRGHLAGKTMKDSELIEVMAAHPDLIQRPVVVRGEKAVLARSIEKLSDLDLS